MQKTRLINLVASSVLLASSFCRGQTRWEWINPLPNFSSVIFAGDRFVAAGTGSLSTSRDGSNWVNILPPETHSSLVLANGNGNYLLCAHDGSGERIYTSPDLENWTRQGENDRNANTNQIIYAFDQFIAVGNTIRTSPDGTSLSLRASLGRHNSIAFGNNLLVAVGYDNDVAISSDGLAWEKAGQMRRNMRYVAFGNGIFISISQNGDSCFVSSDGRTWEGHSTGADLSSPFISFANGHFYIQSGHDLYRSVDGIQWEKLQYLYQTLAGITYGNGRLIGVGSLPNSSYSSTSSPNITSEDGTWWSDVRANNPTEDLTGVAYGNGTFVTTGGARLTSKDGINWKLHFQSSGGTLVESIIFAAQRFVIVDNFRYIVSSVDGENWRDTVRSPSSLYSITFGAGRFVAVGGEPNGKGLVATSPDGSTWTFDSTSIRTRLAKVAYGNGIFVAVTSQGGIFLSTDGKSWTHAYDSHLTGVQLAFLNNRFILMNYGSTYSSEDGVVWDTLPSPPNSSSPSAQAWVDGHLLIGGAGGIWKLEKDSLWTRIVSHPSITVNGFALGGDIIVAVGDQGVILTSPADHPSQARSAPRNANRIPVLAGHRTSTSMVFDLPEGLAGMATATMYSLDGAAVFSRRTDEGTRLTVPLSALPQGIYVLKLSDGHGLTMVSRVVMNRY